MRTLSQLIKIFFTLFIFLGFGKAYSLPASIIFPDGKKSCNLSSLTIIPLKVELTVKDCKIGGSVPTPTPEPSPTPTPEPSPIPTPEPSPSPTPTPTPPPNFGDPGSGLWISPTGVVVFDPSSTSNRTFIPGCIRNENFLTSDCEYNGSMKFGTKYAIRISIESGEIISGKFDRAEAQEQFSGVVGALSTIPGDITPINPKCSFEEISPYFLYSEQSQQVCEFNINKGIIECKDMQNSCNISPDILYYINFTPTQPSCGTTVDCRVQFILN